MSLLPFTTAFEAGAALREPRRFRGKRGAGELLNTFHFGVAR